MPPKAEITNAQVLLETTICTVTEIARIVGYGNPLYFSRMFHRKTGFSPSEFRRQTAVTKNDGQE